ncbi:MAG: ATP-binding cassette domain-containing protein [Proteobacteria bacterium]|nr:ATP-binding cassette domain-containing protein [Pseudomonadota bacterium]
MNKADQGKPGEESLSTGSEGPSAGSAGPSAGKLGSLSTIFRFMLPYKGLLVGMVISLVIAAGTTLAMFRLLQPIIDQGFAAQDATEIDIYFIIFFALVVVLAVSTFFRFLFVTLLGERVVADIRKAVHEHLLHQAPVFFEENRPGEIASRLTADTTLIQNVVGSSLSVALRNALMLVGGVFLLFQISPRLIGIIALVVPAAVIPLVVYGRRVRKLSRTSQDRIAGIGAMADEALRAIQIVQAFTREKEEKERFGNAVEAAYRVARRRIIARAWMMALVILVIFGGIDMGLWQGAKGVISGEMTGGEMASFMALTVLIAGGVGALAEVYGELQRAAGAAGRIAELLEVQEHLPVAENPLPLPARVTGEVAFEGVFFAYPSKPDIWALEDFSMRLRPGETVALVGPSGAGKSTTLQLLLRFFDPQKGGITLDGVDISQVLPHALRSAMAIVPQETIIFADSVMGNVRFGRPEASDDEVWQALAAAQCTDFVNGLSNGIDTYLGESGVRLSGGQRQRLAIARAILRNAPLLLLDEATSSLDTEAERKVQAALEELMKDRTTLVIAHRLATVQAADRIVVLDEGRVVAQGTHAELLAGGGLYARLAGQQFQAEAAQ